MRRHRTTAGHALARKVAAALSALVVGCGGASGLPVDGDIRALRLSAWEPRSMLVAHETRVDRPAFPVIDVHNHLDRRRFRGLAVAEILRIMDETGVRAVVNLDGGSGAHLAAQLD